MSYTIPPIDFKSSEKQSNADCIPAYTIFHTEMDTYHLADGEHVKTEGGQSTVFKCLNEYQIPFAVKVFKEVPSSSQIMLMEHLSHLPNIIPILSSGYTDDGKYFQVMPFMTPALSHPVSSVQEFHNLVRDLVNAVNEIHLADAVHRDITPFNCFWYGKSFYLGDLASAAPIDIAIPEIQQNIHVTHQLHIGTRGYSAPDLYLGVSVASKTTFQTTSADLYSLGATLASICSGKDIFMNMSDSQYYTLLAEEGELPCNFPSYMDAANRSSVRCLINGLTAISAAKRWDLSAVKEWLRNPLKLRSNIDRSKKKSSPVADYSFSPAVYFNGHRYESGNKLSLAMTHAPEEARSFVMSSDFLSYLTNASASLADTICEFKKEVDNDVSHIDVYLCKIIRVLDKCGPNFLFYKGRIYSSIEALKNAPIDVLHDLLKYRLISFNAKHLPNIYSKLSDESIYFLEGLEDFTEKNPDLFKFSTCVLRLFLSPKEYSGLTSCLVITYLCHQVDFIEQFILTSLTSIHESNWEPLAFLYLNGFQNHIHNLLKTLATDISSYEKASCICYFLESVLATSQNDPTYPDASSFYLDFLKTSGPDAFALPFCKYCTQKYISLENNNLLSHLSDLYLQLSEATDYETFHSYIQEFKHLYTTFLEQFQSDYHLSIAGIRCGKNIFSCDKSGFLKKTPLNDAVPIFCFSINTINLSHSKE